MLRGAFGWLAQFHRHKLLHNPMHLSSQPPILDSYLKFWLHLNPNDDNLLATKQEYEFVEYKHHHQ